MNNTEQNDTLSNKSLQQITGAATVIKPIGSLNSKVADFVSILFMLHGIQNIIFFFYPIAAGTSSESHILLSLEVTGGISSIACGYLIIRRSPIAHLAVLLRCFGGIFSWGTLLTLFGLTQISFIALLRVWPLILFFAVSFLILDKRMPKTAESDRWGLFIKFFILLMIANWLLSFVFVSLYFQEHPIN